MPDYTSSFQPPAGWYTGQKMLDTNLDIPSGVLPQYNTAFEAPQYWHDVVQGPNDFKTASDYLAAMGASAYNAANDGSKVLSSYQTPRMAHPLVTTEESQALTKLLNWYHHYDQQRHGNASMGGLTLNDIINHDPAGAAKAYSAHDKDGNPILPGELIVLMEHAGFRPGTHGGSMGGGNGGGAPGGSMGGGGSAGGGNGLAPGVNGSTQNNGPGHPTHDILFGQYGGDQSMTPVYGSSNGANPDTSGWQALSAPAQHLDPSLYPPHVLAHYQSLHSGTLGY